MLHLREKGRTNPVIENKEFMRLSSEAYLAGERERHLTTSAEQIPKYGQIRTENRLFRARYIPRENLPQCLHLSVEIGTRVVHIMLTIFTIMLILYAHKMLLLCSKSPTIMLKIFPRITHFLPKIKYNSLICLHGYR